MLTGFMLIHLNAYCLKAQTGRGATITTTLIVREDSMTLYGFADAAEREVFDIMLSVSGIGPAYCPGKSAQRPPPLK